MKIGILITGHPPENLIEEFGNYGDMFAHLLKDKKFTFSTYTVLENT
ncbi:MAG: type 1 glutamine amidotransferase, partial [Rhodobacteraceae bacterium]|nr:type 1 glutamine amidotransferase [Paracoccaceae bacterium]